MFPQRLEERRAWLRRGFARAVEFALEQNADVFLQVGDLFDTPEPRNAERQFVAEALASLRAAGIPCLGIGGNHDTPRSRGGFAPATPQGTYARLGGLRLLGEGESAGVREGGKGDSRPLALSPSLTREQVDAEILNIAGLRVAIAGISPDPTLPPGSDPLEGLEWHPDADLSLLLVHGSLQGHVFPGAPEPIIQRNTVEQLGVDSLLVGHVHNFATFQWAQTSVIVPGSTERMTFGEMGSRPGFVYMELAPGLPPGITHVPVEPQPRRQIVILSADLDVDDPAGYLKSRLDEECGREAMLRLCLEGAITRQRYHDLHLREVAEYGAARCFFLDLDTSGLYVEDDLPQTVARGGRLSPREELIRYGEEVKETALPADRDLIEEAMRAILSEYE